MAGPRKVSPRDIAVGEYAIKHGIEAAMSEYGMARSTISRRRREAKNALRETDQPEVSGIDERTIQQIMDRYTPKELQLLAKGTILGEHTDDVMIHDFNGDVVTIGVLSDTHLGSKYTNPDHVQAAFDEFAGAEIDHLFMTGDITEGVSSRQGHPYECSHLGVDAQYHHAVQVLGQWDGCPIDMISGNHDAWSHKAVGHDVVERIADAIGANYLGYDEGDVMIGAAKFRLWHGQDGSSYAHSYRLQKVVEAFTGGDKPHVLIAGHVHKMGYWMDRHVHCVSAGCIQKQTRWMRGKRLAAHAGFWILEATLNEKGVAHLATEWFPFYQ